MELRLRIHSVIEDNIYERHVVNIHKLSITEPGNTQNASQTWKKSKQIRVWKCRAVAYGNTEKNHTLVGQRVPDVFILSGHWKAGIKLFLYLVHAFQYLFFPFVMFGSFWNKWGIFMNLTLGFLSTLFPPIPQTGLVEIYCCSVAYTWVSTCISPATNLKAWHENKHRL